jgi:hypothetical protein
MKCGGKYSRSFPRSRHSAATVGGNAVFRVESILAFLRKLTADEREGVVRKSSAGF